MSVFYLSQGQIHRIKNGQDTPLASGAVQAYRRNLTEIQKRNEWKSTGSGAVFMGVAALPREPAEAYTGVEAFAFAAPDRMIYAAALEQNCGLYLRNPDEAPETEGFIIRKNDARIHQLDYSPVGGRIAASVSEGARERHLAIFHVDSTEMTFLTEGDSVDLMPAFSRRNPDLVYYASAGYFIDTARQTVHYSSYGLNRLNLRTGELDELTSDQRVDFIRPREDGEGRLWAIRRPREEDRRGRMTGKDLALAPWRVLKAVGGWLNLFTQRYGGESLKKSSGGLNPSKYSSKSEKEIFIDGNLVNAEKALAENALQGEKYPGVAPKSWELVTLEPDGGATSRKKGVLDYTFDSEGQLVYSNGRYILRLLHSGEEEIIGKANLATNLACL